MISMTIVAKVVSLATKARQKISGDARSPWYTRWLWWIVLGTAAVLVLVIALVISARLSKLRLMRLRTVQVEESARLKTKNAKTREEAAKHRQVAREARENYNKADAQLKEEEATLRAVRAAIAKATTLDELDQIARDLK